MTVSANSIVTPQTPRSSNAAVTTANTTYSTSPTNTVALFTAGANGSRLNRINVIPLATVALAQLQLFRSRDAGVTKIFFNSVQMAAYTMATTTAAPVTDFGYSDDNAVILAANEVVYAASSVTQNVSFNAEGADY